MAEGHIVYKKCGYCSGTGTNPKFVGDDLGVGGVIDDTCPACNGDKVILWGWMTKDDATLPDFIPEIP